MKKHFLVAGASVLILSNLHSQSVSEPPKDLGASMLVNGDFEVADPDTAAPLDWISGNEAALKSSIKVVVDKAVAHSGTGYLEMQVSADNSSAIFLNKKEMPVVSDQDYKLVAWVKGTGEFRLLISQYSDGAFKSSVGSTPTLAAAGSEWECHTLDFRPSDGVRSVRVGFQANGNIECDSVWFGLSKQALAFPATKSHREDVKLF